MCSCVFASGFSFDSFKPSDPKHSPLLTLLLQLLHASPKNSLHTCISVILLLFQHNTMADLLNLEQ